MEKISIIVPIYNNHEYLEKCLLSIQKQTYSNIEVILINDGSTDNSENICLMFAKQDDRFKYFYQSNAGVSAARNRGLKEVTGKFIGFVDSDDWIEPNMYEQLYNLMNATNADISICGMGKDEGDIVNTGCIHFDDDIHILNSEDAVKELLNGHRFGGHLCTKLFRKTCFNDVKFDTEVYICEDLLAVCKIFCRSSNIVFQDKPLYHYYYNKNSAMHIVFNEKKWTVQLACQKICAEIEEYQPNNLVYAESNLLVNNLWLATMLNEVKMLNKENYMRVKKELSTAKNAIKYLDKKSKLKLYLFNMGRIPFGFIWKIVHVCKTVADKA